MRADELAFATEPRAPRRRDADAQLRAVERIDYKSKRDVVTNADTRRSGLVIDAIKERYRATPSLAEASGEHAGVLRDDGSHNGRAGVIDPLDGTVNYANGIPLLPSASAWWWTTGRASRHLRPGSR